MPEMQKWRVEAQAIRNAEAATGALKTIGKIAGVGGAGLGAYDVYQRLETKIFTVPLQAVLEPRHQLAPLAVGTAGVAPAVGLAAPSVSLGYMSG
jgi:hypothetical protein